MTRVQWLVLIAVGAILMTLCCVEVMRGEDPRRANREAVARDLMNLAFRAQDYYHRPTITGGGQGSFVGMTLSKLTSKPTNANGTFSISSVAAQQVVLNGTGTQIGMDGNMIAITIYVFPDSTETNFLN